MPKCAGLGALFVIFYEFGRCSSRPGPGKDLLMGPSMSRVPVALFFFFCNSGIQGILLSRNSDLESH